MSIIKKLIEYSIEELDMAEKYCKLASYFEDAATSSKFNEIAKDEIRHYEFLKSILKKESESIKNDKDEMGKDLSNAYREILDDKKDRIMYKINNFQSRK